MKERILLGLLGLFMALDAYSMVESLYFVGGFNNWDISHPTVVEADTEGLFEVEIDFTGNREFKLSTVNPQGDWNRFDTGTLYPLSSTEVDKWIPIEEYPRSGNIVAPSKRLLTVEVDMNNMQIKFSTGGITGTPWSGTLPVMFIDTQGGAPITSKETYIQATYRLDSMGVEGVESIGGPDDQAPLQIRGRGNYTWIGFEKKPYRIKLDKKTPLLGMDSSKHFALLAHADDSAAGLRNALGFATSEILGMPWTPATQPLEVVLNGDYIGLYWLTETVRVDKDRVNIVEQTDGATEDVDGGWLVEIDNYDSDPHVTVMNSSGQPIWFTYKSPEELSDAQQNYLQTSMQSIQNALASGNGGEASRLVDFDVLARYFMVNQLLLDMESFHGSCYLNRQRGEMEKWKFGPVWDFGNAFAQNRGDNPRFIFDHPEFSQQWIGEFYALPSFVENVKSVWTSFLDGGPEMLMRSLEQQADRIAIAAVSDAKRWPQYAHSDISGEASQLEKWLENSVQWLKTQWGENASVGRTPADCLSIEINGRILEIMSSKDVTVTLYTLDGRKRLLQVHTGMNSFQLTPGFYIIEGKKIVI